MPSTRGFAFSATVRVIDRVHRHTSHMGPTTQPARPARLAQTDVFVVDITHLADRRTTARPHQTHFP
jgi:hypothetical protein